jgi:HK97 family phage prohead protease
MPDVVISELIERRFVVAELRVVDGDDGPLIEGYAAVFDEWSEDLGGFRERIRPGAFAKTIGEADVRGLWQHDPNYVLGRNTADTLELVEDDRGLRYRITPPDTQWARDVLVTMRRGDVNQSSFAFEAVRDEWGEAADGFITRELIEVKLYDVSPVTYPAYPQTSSQVRAKVQELRGGPVAQPAHVQIGEMLRIWDVAKAEGRALTAEELAFCENVWGSIDAMRRTMITSAPGEDPHPEDAASAESARARLDVRRRRLELLEL